MQIDFTKIAIPMDIAKTSFQVADIRKEFANAIYVRGAGVACHALALKIYGSKGEEEYDDKEVDIIKQFAQMCTPAVMDGINDIIEKQKEAKA